LIIAKLDRLARNVAFIATLMESGVDFEAVDFPQANRLTIHIMAAVAEYEAKAISERTKVALAAAKRRGVRLGGLRNHHKPLAAKARAMGSQVVAARARGRAFDLAPLLAELQSMGITTLNGLAAELNKRGISTASGSGRWQATSVNRVLQRARL
jgi:DNA invertase Pin-like site-specific DNA recombinase